MTGAQKPLNLYLYQDALCAWCYVAEQRLEAIRAELGPLIRIRRRPYPLRPHDGAPTAQEVAEGIAELARARQEPEGRRIKLDLWTGDDLPRSSVQTLAALEAARLQGPDLGQALFRRLQRAALEDGINVTRSDVVFEIASRLGLQMNRFSAVYQSAQTHSLIREEHRVAVERGVKSLPTLVIGGRWMISGLREASEYRELIYGCLGKVAQQAFPTRDRAVH